MVEPSSEAVQAARALGISFGDSMTASSPFHSREPRPAAPPSEPQDVMAVAEVV
jgi:hypothetical protein